MKPVRFNDLLDPDSQHLALLLGWCAPTSLPDVLFSHFAQINDSVSSRVVLVDRSFLFEARRSDAGSASGWYMHRVLGDFLRSQSEAAQCIEDCVRAVKLSLGVWLFSVISHSADMRWRW
jgi:hypothetical protein